MSRRPSTGACALGAPREDQMKIRYEYASLDEVPEAVRALYEERGGKFVLAGVEGVKPVSEFETVHRGLGEERDKHRATKAKLAAWGDLSPEETLAKLDRIAELEKAAGGALDEKKIDEIVETRIGSRLGPVERARKAAETALAEKDSLIATLMNERKSGAIRSAVTRAAVSDKVIDTALEDVVLVAERLFEVDDNGKVTVKDTGLSPQEWLADQKAKRPHWWPQSSGGGAGGSSGNLAGENPWTAEHWNFTKQGVITKEKGEAYAARLAQAAGTTLGGPRPKKAK
jgi:hypothetical protein